MIRARKCFSLGFNMHLFTILNTEESSTPVEAALQSFTERPQMSKSKSK